jgi:hypothetical protein
MEQPGLSTKLRQQLSFREKGAAGGQVCRNGKVCGRVWAKINWANRVVTRLRCGLRTEKLEETAGSFVLMDVNCSGPHLRSTLEF